MAGVLLAVATAPVSPGPPVSLNPHPPPPMPVGSRVYPTDPCLGHLGIAVMQILYV